jgi:predicted RNA-binding protein associated with RNAse of E/G family
MQSNRPYFEIKHQLDGSIKRFECLPVHVSDDEAVVIYELTREVRVEDLILPAGSLTFGYFWSNRHYNVYHWVTETGETLGIYFNVCDEINIGKNGVSWRDLIVDLLITPDGRCRVLDTDELPQDLDEELASLIEETEKCLKSQYPDIIAKVREKTAIYMVK